MVSGGCWIVSGWCLRHFFQSGHFVPPPGYTGILDPGSDRVKILGKVTEFDFPMSVNQLNN